MGLGLNDAINGIDSRPLKVKIDSSPTQVADIKAGTLSRWRQVALCRRWYRGKFSTSLVIRRYENTLLCGSERRLVLI